MTNPKHTDTSRSGDLVGDDFAPIWDDSILLAEHEAVQASVDVGGWLSAALDDPNVCDAMKTDINRWFSAGFLYLDEVRKLMQTEREALEAEVERLRDVIDVIWVEASTMRNARKLIGPYPTQPEKNRIWARSVCHIGKRLMEIIQPIRAKLGEKQ